jgi:predicted enzyme related to lactoylglutathione lyase
MTITDIRTITIDVSDQDRALAFFTDTLGFEKRLDAPMSPTSRWIEVAPPGASTSIALNATQDAQDVGTDTGIRFTAADASAAHTPTPAAGVEVGELLRWPDVPPMFAFDDPAGNRFYLIEER